MLPTVHRSVRIFCFKHVCVRTILHTTPRGPIFRAMSIGLAERSVFLVSSLVPDCPELFPGSAYVASLLNSFCDSFVFFTTIYVMS